LSVGVATAVAKPSVQGPGAGVDEANYFYCLALCMSKAFDSAITQVRNYKAMDFTSGEGVSLWKRQWQLLVNSIPGPKFGIPDIINFPDPTSTVFLQAVSCWDASIRWALVRSYLTQFYYVKVDTGRAPRTSSINNGDWTKAQSSWQDLQGDNPWVYLDYKQTDADTMTWNAWSLTQIGPQGAYMPKSHAQFLFGVLEADRADVFWNWGLIKLNDGGGSPDPGRILGTAPTSCTCKGVVYPFVGRQLVSM